MGIRGTTDAFHVSPIAFNALAGNCYRLFIGDEPNGMLRGAASGLEPFATIRTRPPNREEGREARILTANALGAKETAPLGVVVAVATRHHNRSS